MLMGHIFGSAVLFLSIACVSWGLGVAIHWLNGIHAFAPSVLGLITSVELGLLYVDIGLSLIVLIVGAFRFIKELSGPRFNMPGSRL